MVFARNLDKRQPRYRHSKTGDFTVLTWTLVYRFFAFFAKEKEVSNISLWTSYFRLGLRTESTMGLHSGKWRTKHRNTGICL